MTILPDINTEVILERLFPWLNNSDKGFAAEEIGRKENELDINIPTPLKTLYLLAGKEDVPMSSYFIFFKPEELVIDDNKLIFVYEGQKRNYWAISLKEASTDYVYVRSESDSTWTKIEPNLQEFINIVLHYQCIQNGYKYCGEIRIDDNKLYSILEQEWEKVIDFNGLHIYWQEKALIWSNESNTNKIFFSTYFDHIYYLNEIRYDLSEV